MICMGPQCMLGMYHRRFNKHKDTVHDENLGWEARLLISTNSSLSHKNRLSQYLTSCNCNFKCDLILYFYKSESEQCYKFTQLTLLSHLMMAFAPVSVCSSRWSLWQRSAWWRTDPTHAGCSTWGRATLSVWPANLRRWTTTVRAAKETVT